MVRRLMVYRKWPWGDYKDSKEQTVNQNVNQNRKIFIQQNVFWKGRMQNADHYVSTPMS